MTRQYQIRQRPEGWVLYWNNGKRFEESGEPPFASRQQARWYVWAELEGRRK